MRISSAGEMEVEKIFSVCHAESRRGACPALQPAARVGQTARRALNWTGGCAGLQFHLPRFASMHYTQPFAAECREAATFEYVRQASAVIE
jgi:hypothetical protein